MILESLHLFWFLGLSVIMLFIIGLYYMLVTYNLIRVLIGLEIIVKAVTLLLVVAGYMTKHIALVQALIITLIVIEAVLITVAIGVVLGLHEKNDSLDTRRIRNLKG
jgi:multisubunit Na+/H+ antiporter MnhC subunit